MADLIDKSAAVQAVFAWEQGKISGTLADAIAALPAQGVDAADAIKMGFLSAAPGEWRIGDIERVTNAILAALGPAEAGGVEATNVRMFDAEALRRRSPTLQPGEVSASDTPAPSDMGEAIAQNPALGQWQAPAAPVEALVKAEFAEARRTYSGFGHCQEALRYAESMVLAALAAHCAKSGKEVMPDDEDAHDARPATSPGVTAGAVEALVKAADFPTVHRAQDIRLGVLAEEIDPLQGYVTKEDCARYVDATLAAYREGRG